MVLVDIGNTHYHIKKGSTLIHTKKVPTLEGNIFYISVNDANEMSFLLENPNAINLKDYVNFNTEYTDLGIDRIMACKNVHTGLVVDAGSAVTIDIMVGGFHLGGLIMPGIKAFEFAFGKISKKLIYHLDEFDKTKLPNSTKEALSWGSIGSIVFMIEKLRKNMPVFITGGDGEFLSKFVDRSEYIEDLVFRGMIKTIKEDYENSIAKG